MNHRKNFSWGHIHKHFASDSLNPSGVLSSLGSPISDTADKEAERGPSPKPHQPSTHPNQLSKPKERDAGRLPKLFVLGFVDPQVAQEGVAGAVPRPHALGLLRGLR